MSATNMCANLVVSCIVPPFNTTRTNLVPLADSYQISTLQRDFVWFLARKIALEQLIAVFAE